MATFSTFGSFQETHVKHVSGYIRVELGDHANCIFYLTPQQAVQLRDGLSRAIVEAAQASAKAAEGETE